MSDHDDTVEPQPEEEVSRTVNVWDGETNHEVDFTDGMTVGDALQAAKVGLGFLGRKQIFLNGKKTTKETVIGEPGSNIQVSSPVRNGAIV